LLDLSPGVSLIAGSRPRRGVPDRLLGGALDVLPTAGSRMRREDAFVPRSAVTCSVCQRSRTRGSHNLAGDETDKPAHP
jgi:hypothetical protein